MNTSVRLWPSGIRSFQGISELELCNIPIPVGPRSTDTTKLNTLELGKKAP